MKKILVLFICVLIASPSLTFAKKKKSNDEKPAAEKTLSKREEKKQAKQDAKISKKQEKLDAKDAKKQEKLDAKDAKKQGKKSAKNKKNAEPLEEQEANEPKGKHSKNEKKQAKMQAKQDAKAAEKKGMTVEELIAAREEGKEKLVKGEKNVAVSKGIVRLQTVTENGSLEFFVSKNENSWLPVVETSDHAESTYISLFVDDKEFRLNRSAKVSYSFVTEKDSVLVTYRIEGLAELRALYKFSKSNPRNEFIDCDALDVNYTLVNLDSKKHSFALKAVYNTVLGESRASHFSTAMLADVSSEHILIPSKDDFWVISSDGRYGFEFLVLNNKPSSPQKIVLANKDLIEEASPDMSFRSKRSFTSVLSYNNSSVGLFWDKAVVLPEAERLYEYKLNFSTNDFQNAGVVNYIPVPVETETPQIPVTETEPEIVQETPPQDSPLQSTEYLNYDFTTERTYLDPSKINAEYVQRLIDHINSLEQQDPALNRKEIQRLQGEIDEVLKVLRSRR